MVYSPIKSFPDGSSPRPLPPPEVRPNPRASSGESREPGAAPTSNGRSVAVAGAAAGCTAWRLARMPLEGAGALAMGVLEREPIGSNSSSISW